MSEEYNQYIKEHKDNVLKLDRQILSHDDSKYSVEEYYAYGTTKNYAWNHHIHSNPHHWQYWIIPMPLNYIICDWWSFSFRRGDLTEIFHPATRGAVLSQIRRALDRG